MLALAIIATFPFCLLAPLKAKSPIFSFFLGDFLKAFSALYFCGELAAKISSKDINLLNLESFFFSFRHFAFKYKKLYNVFVFKPLISLKSNSRGTKVTGFGTDSFSLILIVKASIKS